MLKIFNSLTKKKELFQSIKNGKVSIYVCGITAYDLCHIGHARTFVIFDTIIRYLKHCGYTVNYVRNITDIDDKIINRSIQNGESYEALTDRMIKNMHFDLDKLNIIRPNYEPRASLYINDIIESIKYLIKKKHAYVTPNGNVFFNTRSYKKYGILSHKKKSIKVIQNEKKNNIHLKYDPTDFALWKSAKPGEKPTWKSPWGNGRPGWHIECSIMSCTLLGTQFDIHGGGIDLTFPHHENEIAQSTCIYNEFNVKTWIHTGMVIFNNTKMSKSLKNSITIRSLLKQYNAETIRFFLLSKHYHKHIEYTENYLKQAHSSLKRLYLSLRNTDNKIAPILKHAYVREFFYEMNNNFNIPGAYSILFKISHKINILKTNKLSESYNMASTLRFLGNILGILYEDPEVFLYTKKNSEYFSITTIEQLIKYRDEARKKQQWKLADKLRNKLTKMNVILEDEKNDTKWRFIVKHKN